MYSANSPEPSAAPCRAEQAPPTRCSGACRVYSANSSSNQHCLQCSGAAATLLWKAYLCTALIVRGRQQRRVGLSKRPRRGVQGPAVCTALIVRGCQQRRVGLSKRPRRGVRGPAVCTALIVCSLQHRRVGVSKRGDAVTKACRTCSASSCGVTTAAHRVTRHSRRLLAE